MTIKKHGFSTQTVWSRNAAGMPEIVLEYRPTFLQWLFRKPGTARTFVFDSHVVNPDDPDSGPWVDFETNTFVDEGDSSYLSALYQSFRRCCVNN